MAKTYNLIKFFFISLVILSFTGYFGYAQKDTCATVTKIKNTIENYIKYGDKKIYKKRFIKTFTEGIKYNNDCYFFADVKHVNLYFYLGDSVLLKRVKTDEKAMELLIDLYLLNRKNVEFSEYYGTRIIPKAAVENTEAFIKVLSKKTEKEANKCIGKLKGILDESDKEKIKTELTKLHKQKYLPIIKKIQEKIK